MIINPTKSKNNKPKNKPEKAIIKNAEDKK